MIDIQALIDGIGAKEQRARAGTQMTLGEMIEALKEMTPDTEIRGLGELYSYRGYYCDLAFEPSDDDELASELLARCTDAMGAVFTGYKGGDFVMGALTPLWVSCYGEASGQRIMSLGDDGSVITEAEDW